MKKALFIGVTIIILAFASYFAFVYYVPYSEGVRSGELIKISHKGVVFKTWEGELSQGISGAQIFKFSVSSKKKAVIEKLKTSLTCQYWAQQVQQGMNCSFLSYQLSPILFVPYFHRLPGRPLLWHYL